MKRGFAVLIFFFVIINTIFFGYSFYAGRVYNEWLLARIEKNPIVLAHLKTSAMAKDYSREPELATENGLVTFRFDDGWESVYRNALPILEKYGFKGTIGVIADRPGNPFSGYMSWEQIRRLEAHGWEVASHSLSHPFFDDLDNEKIVFEIQKSREIILSHNIVNISTFIVPNLYLDKNKDIVISYVVQANGYDNYCSGEGLEFEDDYHIKAITCDALSLDKIKDFVDKAEREKKWAILNFHKIDNSGEEYSVSTEDFAKIVAYVNTKKVRVVTISEGSNLANTADQQ